MVAMVFSYSSIRFCNAVRRSTSCRSAACACESCACSSLTSVGSGSAPTAVTGAGAGSDGVATVWLWSDRCAAATAVAT